jgi:hypothetical protein
MTVPAKHLTHEEIITSMARHFTAGCPLLSASQLESHTKTGWCLECLERTAQERQTKDQTPEPKGAAAPAMTGSAHVQRTATAAARTACAAGIPVHGRL